MCATRVAPARKDNTLRPKRVLIAGEGTNEVGYTDTTGASNPGVLEALARRVVPTGWEVVARRKWKDIPKYRAGNKRSAEERILLQLLLEADEKKFDAVLLARDTDGDKKRAKDLQSALIQAKELCPDSEAVQNAAVGHPNPMLEAWVLAVNGVSHTQGIRDQALRHELLQTFQYDLDEKNTQKLVAMVEGAATQPAADAVGLKRWLKDAEKSLCGP